MLLQRIKNAKGQPKQDNKTRHKNHPQSRSRGTDQQSWNRPKPHTARPTRKPGRRDTPKTPRGPRRTGPPANHAGAGQPNRKPRDRPPRPAHPRTKPAPNGASNQLSERRNARGSWRRPDPTRREGQNRGRMGPHTRTLPPSTVRGWAEPHC